jgi:hypothetical protein
MAAPKSEPKKPPCAAAPGRVGIADRVRVAAVPEASSYFCFPLRLAMLQNFALTLLDLVAVPVGLVSGGGLWRRPSSVCWLL